MRNFLGQDGFVWWVGIVEDVADPLTLGRCRVRIFGYHPAKSSGLVPTEDLPWAVAIHSLSTPNLYAPMQKGDWVFGFFIDSTSAQEPAILGYYPAIPATSEVKFSDNIVSTRNFNRVHTANNSSNTLCWEFGNNIIEIVKESATESNGHIIIQHKTGSKITMDTNGNISVHSANVSITATDSMTLSANTLTIKDSSRTWTPTTLFSEIENAKELPVPEA